MEYFGSNPPLNTFKSPSKSNEIDFKLVVFRFTVINLSYY